MKKLVYIWALLFSGVLFAQDEVFSGALSHEKYFENPRGYLEQINPNLFPTDVLIDRVLFEDILLNVNGKNKVTTTEYQDFYAIYQSLKYAHNDTNLIIPFDTLLMISERVYDYNQTNIISIIDFDFNRIKSEAITNGDFFQGNHLVDNGASNHSFFTDRAVSFSPFTHNLHGDEIKFILPKAFFISNIDLNNLTDLEVDFGNGQGFKTVSFDEEIIVKYNMSSDYIEMKLKLNYLNNNQITSFYAHHSIYYQSTIYSTNNDSKSRSRTRFIPKPPPDLMIYYPERTRVVNCVIDEADPNDCLFFYEYYDYKPFTLEVAILFNPQNKSEKLRKPLLMVDGFDPGDRRDYYSTRYSDVNKLLEKENDFRGLFDFLDGKRSPWDEEDEENSNMVSALQNDGYDLIFINFKVGAGDVLINAARLQQFLNEVVNSSKYRDNKTEEMILVGPSMGGLITRIALKEMELAGEEHFVKSWISFDSPHSGAYIPLSVQYFLKLMSESEIDDIKEQGNQKLGALKSMAAQQLLNVHILSSDKMSGTIKNHELYDYLNIGYPNLTKRYGITNGGKDLLYEISDVKQIIKLKVLPSIYGLKINFPIINLNGYALKHNRKPLNGHVLKDIRIIHSDIYIFWNKPTLKVYNPITYENTPGGWHTALYSLNRSEDNSAKINSLAEHYDKATFIPTVSAFGIPISKETSHLTHEAFTNINDFSSGKIRTPFDAIHGMKENEEHVKISVNTKNDIIEKWLQPDNIVTQRPVVRHGEPIHQTASKPVGYLVKESISFAGNNNTFTFKNRADANIVSGNTIKFLPGFSIQSGAKMSAKIEGNEDVILKKEILEMQYTDNRNYLNNSPYHEKIYNYDISNPEGEIKSYIKIQIYPNPVQDFVNLLIEEDFDHPNIVNIHDVNGKLMYSSSIVSNQNQQINTQAWVHGVYFVTVNGKNNIEKTKIIK